MVLTPFYHAPPTWKLIWSIILCCLPQSTISTKSHRAKWQTFLNIWTSPHFNIILTTHVLPFVARYSKCIARKSFASLFCHWIWSELRRDLMYKPYSTPMDFLLLTTNSSVCMHVFNHKNSHSDSNKDICKCHRPKYLLGWEVYTQRR